MADPNERSGNGSLKKRRNILVAVAVAAVLSGGYFWYRSMGHETTDNAQLDGNIVPVRASVAGYVHEVRFTDDQHVHAGDTLLLIEDKDYRAMVAQSEAALASAEAQLEAARSGHQSAEMSASASQLSGAAMQDNVSSAETRQWKAQRELERVQAMVKDDAATPQQLDAAKAEVDVATAMLQAARKQADASGRQADATRSQSNAQRSQVALAQAMVAQREAELHLARIRLGHTAVLAPFDCVVSRKSVEPGQYIAVGMPMCSAVDQAHIWVTANFKETQITDMRPGQPVEVHLDAFPDVVLSGHLASFSGATGAKFSLLPPDNATGNFVKVTQRIPVRIALDPMQDSDVYLAPGLSATVDVTTKG
ncbi:MAG: HlyD family secretion protein [Flavobacteriales bacterium]|nr:HlyD family secretion protein [Flavobacteriales bacterium]MCB9193234.1 HlyD family secretion protein [Flavobacteriales bacterium]